MSVVIEAGPGTIRRLCRDAAVPAADAEATTAALDALDEPVALVAEQPVCVDELWRNLIQELCGGPHPREPVIVIHPSWWSPARVARVRTAAAAVAGRVATHRRGWLLATATRAPNVVVEIAGQLVVITGTAVAAEPRTGDPGRVAAAVARRVTAMTSGSNAAVLIDAPGTVGGAVALAAMIAGRLRCGSTDLAVRVVDDTRLIRLAAAVFAAGASQRPGLARGDRRRRHWPRTVLPGAAVALTIMLAGVSPGGRGDAPVVPVLTTTNLVEGRITLEVPAQWPVQRVTAGPGSARVVLTSPSDPQVALHVTQSRVPDADLAATAQSLEAALADQPAGVFVDVDPAGQRAGRPAVTYREVRAGHDIRWSILLDDTVRISIGCQGPSGDENAVRDVCDRAVASAHKLG